MQKITSPYRAGHFLKRGRRVDLIEQLPTAVKILSRWGVHPNDQPMVLGFNSTLMLTNILEGSVIPLLTENQAARCGIVYSLNYKLVAQFQTKERINNWLNAPSGKRYANKSPMDVLCQENNAEMRRIFDMLRGE
ncbi:hypothetical protein [uncultured Umboniibacter sp.]|uniref:hypothetical protein n=1 Tax=uncultured Umboniibacter sp. TaxID=1798917 RepID=UPI00263046AC|nr:hypothetical protein [uncultured Umboniibacter sp.]